MKSWISVGLTVAMLSSSTVAMVPEAQAFPSIGRIVKGAVGAVAAGGALLGGFIPGVASAEWGALAAVGITGSAGLFVLPAAISLVGGGGLYALTRAIVGNGPEPWRNALPGFVAGAGLLAVAAAGVAIPIAIGGVAALSVIALAPILIPAAIGLGFLAYGGYRWWKAAHDKGTQPGPNPNPNPGPNPNPNPQPPVVPPVVVNPTPVPPAPPVHGPVPLPLPGSHLHSGPAGTNVARNDNTTGNGTYVLPPSTSGGPNAGFNHGAH